MRYPLRANPEKKNKLPLFVATIVLGAISMSLLCCNLDHQVNQINQVNGQDTPRALIYKWHKAIVENDRDMFLQCCYIENPEWRKAAIQCLLFMNKSIEFKSAIEKQFGPDGWSKYRMICIRKGGLSAKPPPVNSNWIPKVKINQENGHASFEFPGSIFPNKLIKKGDVWFLDVKESVAFDDPKIAAQFFETARKAIVKGMQALQRTDNTTLQDAYQEIQKEYNKNRL